MPFKANMCNAQASTAQNQSGSGPPSLGTDDIASDSRGILATIVGKPLVMPINKAGTGHDPALQGSFLPASDRSRIHQPPKSSLRTRLKPPTLFKRRVSFAEKFGVRMCPTLDDYSSEEYAASFYGPLEYEAMQDEVFKAIKILRELDRASQLPITSQSFSSINLKDASFPEHGSSPSLSRPSLVEMVELLGDFSFRGIEHMQTQASAQARRLRRREVCRAVFIEQARQLSLMASSGCSVDSHAIASCSTALTVTSCLRAIQRGEEDERAASDVDGLDPSSMDAAKSQAKMFLCQSLPRAVLDTSVALRQELKTPLVA